MYSFNMKSLIILLIITTPLTLMAYETHQFKVWDDEQNKIGWTVIRITTEKGITYASEAVYTKRKVPTGPKNTPKEKILSIRRAWAVLHRGLRLGQYRRWIPANGQMTMFMLFRYGRRIKQRIESVLGGNASVKVVTRNRAVKPADPYGIMWALLVRRLKKKQFQCINPVTGTTGEETISYTEKQVDFPLRGTLNVKAQVFSGDCANIELYFHKRRLIGAHVQGLFFELSCRHCKKHKKDSQ